MWPSVERTIRLAVLAYATVVASGLLLGFTGGLTPVLLLPLAALALVAGWRSFGSGALVESGSEAFMPGAAVGVAVLAMLVAFVLAAALSHPPTAYDSLTYHLFFPARWLQLRRLTIIPTPFGDEAPAYAPSDGELAFLALLMPFRSDAIARAGQVPFYALSGLVVYALARRAGASSVAALYAPMLFLLTPTMRNEAETALVDVIWTSMFLATFHFGLRARETGDRKDEIFAGICLGLFLGTKFAALPYLPALLPLAFTPRFRQRAAWLLPGLLVCGAPWYLRNWIVTGSPVYPLRVELFGHPLTDGAYERTAMLASVFHREGWQPALLAIAHAFSLPVLLLIAVFTLAGLSQRRFPPGSGGFPLVAIVAGAIALLPLFWFGIPYNSEFRFLLPAVGLMCAAAPTAFGRSKALDTVLHLAAIGVLARLLGLAITVSYLWLFVSGVGLTLLLLFAARDPRRFPPVAALVALTAGTGLTVWSVRACPTGCEITASPGAPRELLATWQEAWQWTDAHAPARIAYAGTNAPYPLLGPHYENEVEYVNIDAHRGWRFDDYDRARPVIEGPATSAKPAFERRAPDAAAWIANLRDRKIEYVYVTTLSKDERAYLEHDTAGFPIEAAWMAARPSTFRLVFGNADVRIYAVAAPSGDALRPRDPT